MTTPIMYYGGKTSLLHHILPIIPRHKVYTEVFFGGGAVFWAKQPVANETINDQLDYVVNFYEVLKRNFPALKKEIDTTLLSRTHHRKALKIIRSGSMDTVQLAWAFWMTANFSFSNKIGGGMKYSNDQNTVSPDTLRNKKDAFTELLVRRIESAYIENKDALQVLESRNVAHAFHFIDPPYMNADQGHYAGYTEQQFCDLLQWLETCKGKFLLSNYPSDILQEFIQKNGWHTKVITARRRAPRQRMKAKSEVLIANFPLVPEGQLSFDPLELNHFSHA